MLRGRGGGFLNLGARWGSVVKATPRSLYPRETQPVPILQEDEWASGPGTENFVPDRPARNESLTD